MLVPVGALRRHRIAVGHARPLPPAAAEQYGRRVYWFSRPPYLRWVGAALIILIAAWVDLRPAATVPYPFAAEDVPAGATIDAGLVTWRQVPDGLLPIAPDLGGAARFAIKAGEPILASSLTADRPSIPAGWWALETHLPENVVPGQEVKVVVVESGVSPLSVPGVIIEAPPATDPLGYEDPVGLVAVPAEAAAAVAAGSARGDLSVLIGSVP